MCVQSRGKDTKLAKEQARKGQTGQELGNVEKELMSGKGMTEERKAARKAPRTANLIGTVTKTKDPMGTKAEVKAKVKARAKLDTATIAENKGTSE